MPNSIDMQAFYTVSAMMEKLPERNKRLQSRIAVDLDGVLANFVLGWARVAYQAGYVHLPGDWQPKEWSFHKALGLSDEQNNNVWRKIAATSEFWNTLLPYQENIRALQHFLMMEQDKHDVFYLTSRVQGGERSVLSQTQDWLRRYLLLG
ncbi:MAG: hypothetical protein MN733_39760, partial [Nitrososphaera sp.]|nr:hypothetical protein [Nitrososphaera sp.]